MSVARAGRSRASIADRGRHSPAFPPLIVLALVATPFSLEEVEDGGEGVVLAALRGEGDLGGLGPLLLPGAGRALLRLLLARRGHVGAAESAHHFTASARACGYGDRGTRTLL